MPGTPADVAAAAKRGLAQGSQEYSNLSSKMCWDAVVECAKMGGVNTNNQGNKLIDQHAPGLTRTEMDVLPPGHVIGFFHGAELIHVMISTGGSMAAGNKNDCVGVGKSVGWEEHDLVKGLKWDASANSITAPRGEGVTRTVTVHHKVVTEA